MPQPYHKMTPSASTLEQIARKFLPIFPGNLPLPEFKVANNYNSPWLGRCVWRMGQENTTIFLQKKIFTDEETLDRVVAHELCHHADFILNELPEYQKNPRAAAYMLKHRDGHGAPFMKFAEMINSRFGEKYITKVSDMAMVTDNVADYWCILVKKPSGAISWAVARRPSNKQKGWVAAMMASARPGVLVKLVKLNDPMLAHGTSIGNGLSLPLNNDSEEAKVLKERLEYAWEHGKEIGKTDGPVIQTANASVGEYAIPAYAHYVVNHQFLSVAYDSVARDEATGATSVFEEVYLPIALRKPEALGVVMSAMKQARYPENLKLDVPSQLAGCVELHFEVPDHDITFTIQAEQAGKVKLDVMEGSNRKNILTRDFGPTLWAGTAPLALATILLHCKRGITEVLEDLGVSA